MNKWGMKGIVLGLCLSMMAPMAVAMVPECGGCSGKWNTFSRR